MFHVVLLAFMPALLQTLVKSNQNEPIFSPTLSINLVFEHPSTQEGGQSEVTNLSLGNVGPGGGRNE